MMDITDIRRESLQRLIDQEYGGKQARFIEKTGINQGELSAILRGSKSFGEKKARSLEDLAGLPPLFFDQVPSHTQNVRPIMEIHTSVPIITWLQAGNWGGAMHGCSDKQQEFIRSAQQVSETAFGLRVVGDSMVNPNGSPSFPEGYVLIVERLAKYKPDSFVIAKTREGEVMFKQIVKDGPDWYLKPLNPRYPIKPLGDAEIIGVVVEAILNLR